MLDNGGTTTIPPAPNNYGVASNSDVNSQGQALNRCDRSSYKQLMYGGYNQRQGQYQNLPNRLRIVYDRNLPGSLIEDFTHPDAFKNGAGDVRVTAANAGFNCPQQGMTSTSGVPVDCSDTKLSKRDSEILSEPDANGNVNSFYEAGFSRGLG